MEDGEPLKTSGGALRSLRPTLPFSRGRGGGPGRGRGCSKSPDRDLTTCGTLSAPLPCVARGSEACVSAGEVPLLQRSQAQSQAAWAVPAVLGVRQAQVGAGLPGFHCLPFWKATRHPVCLVTPVSQDSVATYLWSGGLFLREA